MFLIDFRAGKCYNRGVSGNIPENFQKVRLFYEKFYEKILSLALVLGMTVMFLPLYGTDFPTVFATEMFEIVSDDFQIKDGVLTAYTGSDSAVFIPPLVTAIGDGAFVGNTVTETVYFSSSVTSIGMNAFAYCDHLKAVYMTDSVTSIGSYAFNYCTALEQFSFPASVTTVSEGCLSLCTALKEVTLPIGLTSVENYAFMGCDALTTVYYSAEDSDWETLRTHIGSYNDPLLNAERRRAFIIEKGTLVRYQGTDTSVRVPNGVTAIGEEAFKDNTYLEGVNFPASVKTIGKSAFEGCSELYGVSLPAGLTAVGDNAFADCSSLSSIYFDGTYEQWKEITFGDGNDSLVYAEVITKDMMEEEDPGEEEEWEPAPGFTIKDGVLMYYRGSDPDVTVPEGVTEIGYEAFSWSSGVKHVTLPDGVTTIGAYAFSSCDELETITLPDSLTTIGGSAFSRCAALKSVTLPADLTSIGGYAFAGCTSLTGITIPDTVTSIGESAFRECSALTGATLSAALTAIQDNTFMDCNALTSLTIPDHVKSIGAYAFARCKSLSELTLPDSVETIGYSAFFYCTSLSGINLPSSVQTIDWFAFEGCSSLTEIVIPASVTKIGSGVLENCTSLTTATLLCRKPDLDGTIYLMFDDCTALKTVNFAGSMKEFLALNGGATLEGVTVHCAAEGEPLAITAHPVNVTAKSGDTVKFEVKATGTGLTYQWQLSDDAGKTWRDSSNKTAEYSTTLSDKNNGRYVRCVVTDKYGNAVKSNAVSMSVKSGTPLAITAQPEAVTALNGDLVTFKVKAIGDGLTYQW